MYVLENTVLDIQRGVSDRHGLKLFFSGYATWHSSTGTEYSDCLINYLSVSASGREFEPINTPAKVQNASSETFRDWQLPVGWCIELVYRMPLLFSRSRTDSRNLYYQRANASPSKLQLVKQCAGRYSVRYESWYWRRHKFFHSNQIETRSLDCIGTVTWRLQTCSWFVSSMCIADATASSDIMFKVPVAWLMWTCR